MKKLNFALENLQIEIEGQTYTLRYPNWGEVEALSKMTINADMRNFLISVGLPGDAIDKLQVPHFKSLISELTAPDSKKN